VHGPSPIADFRRRAFPVRPTGWSRRWKTARHHDPESGAPKIRPASRIAFFRKGVSALRPLVLRDIAIATELARKAR